MLETLHFLCTLLSITESAEGSSRGTCLLVSWLCHTVEQIDTLALLQMCGTCGNVNSSKMPLESGKIRGSTETALTMPMKLHASLML